MKGSQQESRESRTIFVGGIPVDMQAADLSDYLSKFDRVEKLQVPVDRCRGVFKGYAKAVLATALGVEKIVSHIQHILGGLKDGILRWQSRESFIESKDELMRRKVHVRLPDEYTWQDLHGYFSQFEGLEEVIVKNHPITKRPRNFCYILFTSKVNAQRVVDLSPHTVNDLQLECNISLVPQKHKKENKLKDEESSERIKSKYMEEFYSGFSTYKLHDKEERNIKDDNLQFRKMEKPFKLRPDISWQIEASFLSMESRYIFSKPTDRRYHRQKQFLMKEKSIETTTLNYQYRLKVLNTDRIQV